MRDRDEGEVYRVEEEEEEDKIWSAALMVFSTLSLVSLTHACSEPSYAFGHQANGYQSMNGGNH